MISYSKHPLPLQQIWQATTTIITNLFEARESHSQCPTALLALQIIEHHNSGDDLYSTLPNEGWLSFFLHYTSNTSSYSGAEI